MNRALKLALATCQPVGMSVFAGTRIAQLLIIIASATVGAVLYFTDNPADDLVAIFLMAGAIVMFLWELRLMIAQFVIYPQKFDFERPRTFYSDAIKQAIAQKIQKGQCEPLSQAELNLPYLEQQLRLTPDELALVCKRALYSLTYRIDWNDLTRTYRQNVNDLLRHAAELTYGISRLKRMSGSKTPDYYKLQNIINTICQQTWRDACVRLFTDRNFTPKQIFFTDDFDRLDQLIDALIYFSQKKESERSKLALMTSHVLEPELPTVQRKKRTLAQKIRFVRFVFIVHFFGVMTKPGQRYYDISLQAD